MYFDEYYGELPEPVFSVGDLRGGKEDTPPEITNIVLRPYRNNIFLDFVDHDMLFQAAEEPNVLVTVDEELLSVCTGECLYNYLEECPQVTDIEVQGA